MDIPVIENDDFDLERITRERNEAEFEKLRLKAFGVKEWLSSLFIYIVIVVTAYWVIEDHAVISVLMVITISMISMHLSSQREIRDTNRRIDLLSQIIKNKL